MIDEATNDLKASKLPVINQAHGKGVMSAKARQLNGITHKKPQVHGTEHSYRSCGCRCAGCVEAYRAKRELKNKKIASGKMQNLW